MTIPHCQPPTYPPFATKAPLASRVAREDPAGCHVAILGLADDLGVRLNRGRPGAANGPRAFREAFARYGVAEPFGWDWPRVFDAGDIIPATGDDEAALRATHERVTDAVKAILDLGVFPIGIGGGHDLTLPFVRGVIEWHAEQGPRKKGEKRAAFHGRYFDAHLDVRETVGSGMPFRELIEECGVESLTIHGFNPFANTHEHVEWFLDNGGSFGGDHPDTLTQFDAPAFVSFDMDVLDASAAPGVSALNPAGWTSIVAEAWLDELGADPNVKCFDIMEFNPAMDVDGRTARVAVHLFLAFLHGFARRQAAQCTQSSGKNTRTRRTRRGKR